MKGRQFLFYFTLGFFDGALLQGLGEGECLSNLGSESRFSGLCGSERWKM